MADEFLVGQRPFIADICRILKYSYSSNAEIKRNIPTKTCFLCHVLYLLVKFSVAAR